MDIRRSGESHNDNDGSGNQQKQGAQQNAQSMSMNQNNQSGGSNPILWVIVLLVLVAGGVYFFGGDFEGIDNTGGDGPVAQVGGEAIERAPMMEQLTALRESTSSQAQEFQQLSETRQQELVLSGIINQALLRQAAENAGVSVSDQEVDNQLQSQIEQIGGQEEFQNRLEQNDLTEQEVRENLREQLLISGYVTQSAGTTTDQQVQQLYDQYQSQLSQAAGTSSQNIPSLEQLRPQLEAQIQQQAQQQLLQQARNNIAVEVLLDGVSYPPSTPQTQGANQPTTGQSGAATGQPTTNNGTSTGN